MYLSFLLVDVGTNPDRPRPGRLWLRNLYRVHQRLCMAFPSNEQKTRDAEFLQPYRPDNFAHNHVHTRRSKDTGFLFRLDPMPGGNPIITVQSASRPDWDYAFHNASFLLAGPPLVRVYEPDFTVGERLRFRLKANPTKRASKNSKDPLGRPLDPKWMGKRIPVPLDSTRDWLIRRAKSSGFTLIELTTLLPGYVYVKFNDASRGHRLRSVLFEGFIRVTQPDALADAVAAGIGPGKAFGFGLLSLARV